MALIVAATLFTALVLGGQTYVILWCVRRIEQLQAQVRVLQADAGITSEWIGRKS